MRRLSFVIPSLVAAGLAPAASASDDAAMSDQPGDKNFLDQIVADISESQTYTLAAHRSHASHSSHGSHQSHGSHRSSGYFPAPTPSEEGGGFTAVSHQEGRNVQSTPPSAVLPSSPALTRKLKVLPGNSEKFRNIVMRAQIALSSRGYDIGAVSGEIDARTTAAIYEFQDGSGMVPSGRLTPETLSALGIVQQ